MKKTFKQLLAFLIVVTLLLSTFTVALANSTGYSISVNEVEVNAAQGVNKLVFTLKAPAGTKPEMINGTNLAFSFDHTKVQPVKKSNFSAVDIANATKKNVEAVFSYYEDDDYEFNFAAFNIKINDTRTGVNVSTYYDGDDILIDTASGMVFTEFYFVYTGTPDADTFKVETDRADDSFLGMFYNSMAERNSIVVGDYIYGAANGNDTVDSFTITYTNSDKAPVYPLKNITLTPAVATVEVPTVIPAENAETVAITAKAINTKDQEMALPADAVWSLKSAPAGVTLSNTGVLTVAPNAQAGIATIALTSGGVEYTTEVSITRATPVAAKITLTANGADVANYAVVKPITFADPAKTVAFVATAKDQYGEVFAANIAIDATSLTGTSFANNTLTVNSAADNGNITVTATLGTLTDSVNVKITSLEVNWLDVNATEITYGQTIAEGVEFPRDNKGTATVDGTVYNGVFSVVNGTATPAAGTANAQVAFKITDEGEFKDLVITKEFAVTVNKANYNMNSVIVDNKVVIYNGQPQEIIPTGTLPSGVSVSAITYNGSLDKPVNANTYNVVVSFTGDAANYNAIPDKTATLTINKADAIITANEVQTFVYDATAKSASASLNHAETALIYSAQDFVNVGEYDVTISADATANYNAATKQVKVVIEKAVATGFVTVAPTVTYTAKEAFDASITSTSDIKTALNLPATVTATFAGGTEEVNITWADATENWNDKMGTYTFVGTATSDNLAFPAGMTLTATATVTPSNVTITSQIPAGITVAESALANAGDHEDIRFPDTVTLDIGGSFAPVWSKTLDELKAIPVGGSVSVEITNFPVWATILNPSSIAFSVTDKYPVEVTVTLPYNTYVYGTPVDVPTAIQTALADGTDDSATFKYTYTGTTVYGAVYESETAPVTVGTYKVIAEVESPTHYGKAEFSFTITPLDVTYQVNDATKKYKDANPAFTGFATSALAYADTEADLGVSFNCPDTTDFVVGPYPNIITAAISNPNYNLVNAAQGALTVVKKPLAEVGTPVISGTAAVGEVLTATLDGVDPAEYNYQWYVNAAPVATSATYTPAIADSNKAITVDIIAKDSGNYDGTVTSDAVTVAKYAITGALTASITDGALGTPAVLDAGDTVAIDVTSIDNYAELDAAGITFDYQWFVNGTAITGETASSITLVQGLLGTLSVKVTANGNFTGTVEHSLGEINKLALTGALTIALADGVISYTSTLPGTLNTDYTLAWYQGTDVIGTDSTYTVTSAVYGKTVTLKAIAIGNVYTGEVVSNDLTVPAIAPSNVQIAVSEASGSIIAKFTADENGAAITGFDVTITDGTNTQTAVVTPVNGQFTYTFSGLHNGTTYTITATATNVAGTSAPATVTATPRAATGGGNYVTYTVKFNTGDGITIKTQSVSKHGTVTEPAAPVKEGYIFEGWYKDSAFTKPYDFSAKVSSSFTLYAKWTKVGGDGEPGNTDEPVVSTKLPFADVAETDWYYNSVKFAYENKLMSGTSDSTFDASATLTRAMLVTILYRNAGEPATNRSIPFGDIDMGAYYANAVSWAKQNGIISGVTENEFAPNANITREQIATIMFRYAQYKGMDAITLEENLHFEDSAEISEYAISAMNWAVGTGLMKGKTETTINSKDNATRAEIATILQRFIESNK